MQEIRLIKMQTKEQLAEMSALATSVLREHYDPIVGKKTNDHMLEKYQSVRGIKEECDLGAEYYFSTLGGKNIGFVAIDAKRDYLYLSKFYLVKEYRGHGYSSIMMDFVKKQAVEKGKSSIRLNVNAANENTIATYRHFGFDVIQELQKDVGDGFSVHDYVMQCNIE